ncbi:hypothetical protein TNIN_2581 [Trichonephila inaurata madagascariensis]|uniref:Uncharacterized protein n=1 Tax=Trichonephila inaurata madagascariensis TaxID=2747483 RepID=A0A8X7CM88_9ARAC|nr:hypothetical protein TNIN_2581 [Trichonephila inaurata madagascariensis]
MVIPYRCGKGSGPVPWAAIKRPKAGQPPPGNTLHSLFLFSRAGYLSSFMALNHRRGIWDGDLDEKTSCAHWSRINFYCGGSVFGIFSNDCLLWYL